MSEDEFLSRVLALFPNALISEDGNGEVVVDTGLRLFDGLYLPMIGDK